MGEFYGSKFYLNNVAVIQYIFIDEQLYEWNSFERTIYLCFIYLYPPTHLSWLKMLRLFMNIMYLKLMNEYIKFPHFLYGNYNLK